MGYTIPNLKLDLNFKAITNLLMGENIYGKKMHGLRELIQNSIDATKVREEHEKKSRKYGEEVERPTVKVILDKNNNQLIVKDNGIGMTLEVINSTFAEQKLA